MAPPPEGRTILPAIDSDASPGSSTRLAFVGDTTLASVKAIAKRIGRDQPDAVVFCGDVANELPSAPAPRHYRRWRARWGALADRLYPLPGNHDYASNGSLEAWWEGTASRLGSRAQWFEQRAFVLRLPFVTVFGLDCGPSGRRIDSAQLEWMTRQAVEGERTPWRILALHGPLVPVSLHMNHPMADASQDGARRLAVAAGVQLVICGHEHLYARTGGVEPPIRAQVVTGGGGAPLYPVVRSGLPAAASRVHHLVLDAAEGGLRGQAVGEDGEAFDSWTWADP